MEGSRTGCPAFLSKFIVIGERYSYTDGETEVPATLCDVYTIAEGKAVPLIEQALIYIETDECIENTGWKGHAAIIKRKGKTYFTTTYDACLDGGWFNIGEPWNYEKSILMYSINGAKAEVDTEVLMEYQMDYDEDYKWTINPKASVAWINGKYCDYKQYEKWANVNEEIVRIDTWKTYNSEDLPEDDVPSLPDGIMDIGELYQWLLTGQEKNEAHDTTNDGQRAENTDKLSGSYGKQLARTGKNKSFPYSEYEKLPKAKSDKSEGFTYPFELNGALRQCRGFHLDYEIKEIVKGKLEGNFRYEVLVRNLEGKWKSAGTFDMEDYSISLDVKLKEPMSVTAVAVTCGCPNEVAYSFEMAVSDPK